MNRYSARSSDQEILEETADKVEPIHVNEDWTAVAPINNSIFKFDQTVDNKSDFKKIG